MKKVLCLLLCMVFLLGVLVACGGEDTNTPGGDAAGTTTPSGDNPVASNDPSNPGTTTATPPDVKPGRTSPTHEPKSLADAMGNPRTYNVMVRQGRYSYFYGTESSTGTVQKAAYQRNQLLCDMYDIDLTITQADGSKAADWNTKLGAADGEYDLALPDYWWGVEYAGHFENVMTINEINDADEWWVQGWNDNMIINNRMYTFVGDAALEIYENVEVIFYNKSIEEEYDYDLYQTVVDGEWTIDKMLEMIDVFEDALNNNDTSDDVYGVMYDIHSIKCAMYSAGVTLLKTNRNNGVIQVIANTERNVNVVDKLAEVWAHTSTLETSATARAADISPFLNGQAFMYAGWLYGGQSIKNANTVFDYGIVVAPKYEEADEYRSTAYGVSFFGIPASAADISISALVCDTMNWLSNTEDERGLGEERIVYVYYDTVVKGQITNSPHDNEMIDLARNTSYYDFGFIINSEVKLESGFVSAITSGSSLSSSIDALEQTADAGLTDMVAFYNK